MSIFDIEGIPWLAAGVYSNIVARSPVIKDFYRDVAGAVVAKVQSGSILDIGTGPGYIPIDIALSSPALAIRAIDISQEMVNIATKNALKAGAAQRIQFKFGSAEKIPFDDRSFDLIISTLSFHHWAHPEKCFMEILRTLKPGGEAWIYEIRRDVPPEAKQELRKKYGWFITFLVLPAVRSHSSVKLQRFKELHSLCNLGYSRIATEENGITMRLMMLK